MAPPSSFQEENLLCLKGLARRQGLVGFISRQGIPTTEDVGPVDSRSTLLLCHDDGIIREVFNSRAGDLNLVDESLRQAEWAKRNTLLRLLYRLYRAGRDHTPAELRREIRTSEVEAVISAIQRLSFMGNPTADELVAFCEHSAKGDDDVLGHVMDPFQLRHILSFHHPSTREQIGSESIATLVAACRERNIPVVQIWFHDLIRNHEFLPKDTPQLLRAILLSLWKSGQAELGALAFEIAVLDVQLFDDLGWESTRAFCTQLRRATGPGCESLDSYLTDEDIDDALTISEELRQDDLVVHFRKLATTYNTQHHRALRKRVLVAAGKAAESASTPPVPVATPRPSTIGNGRSSPPSAWGRRPTAN